MARVSTREQAIERATGVRKTSIDAQLKQGEAYCQARDWEVAGQYADEGASGTTLDRPELQRALADARAGRLNVLVFTKWDRLARALQVGLDLIAQTAEIGVDLVVLEGGFDTTTPMGKAMMHIFLVFAQLQRDTIVEQMAVGQHNKARAGRWPGGKLPYGYRAEGNGPSARIVLHQAETAMLRLVVGWLVNEGIRRPTACVRLNQQGYRQRNGQPWNPDNLRDILANPTLKGEFMWGGPQSSGKYGEQVTYEVSPAVLTPAEWDALQRATTEGARPQRRGRAPYPLGNSAMTSPCGHSYGGVFKNNWGKRTYRCGGARWKADPNWTRCGCPILRADPLDDRVYEQVRLLLGDPARLRELAESWLNLNVQPGPQADRSAELATVQMRVAQLERSLTETVVEYARQGLPAAAVKAATDAIERDLAGLRARLDQLTAWQADQAQAQQAAESLEQLATRAAGRLAGADRFMQAELLRLLQVKVTVLDDSPQPALRIEGSVPVPAPDQGMKQDGGDP